MRAASTRSPSAAPWGAPWGKREGVIFEGGLGAAHAEHAVARAHRARLAVQRHRHAALLVHRNRAQRHAAVPLARPEFQHITLGQGLGRAQQRLPVLHLIDAPQKQAAVVGALITHDIVAALALEIGGSEAAGERLGQTGVRIAIGRRGHHGRKSGLFGRRRDTGGQSLVQRLTVHRRDSRHVLGRLHAALDFQREHPGIHQLVDDIDGAQILGRQQVIARRRQVLLHRCVAQLVGQPARLGAHAAVGRTAANEGGHEALARVAHAQRAVSEHLYLDALLSRGRGQQLHLGQRQLARQGDALGAQAGRRAHTGQVMGVHLGGQMQRRFGQRARQLAGQADVLHDEPVGAGTPRLAHALQGLLHLAGQNDRVHGDVDRHAALVGIAAGLAQGFDGEVVGAAPGVERFQSQIDGIGARLDGGVEGRLVARGGQKLDGVIQHDYSFLRGFPSRLHKTGPEP